MVRIVSTHAILGDDRTGDMYGWGLLNPDIDKPNGRGENTEEHKAYKRIQRKKLKEKEDVKKFSGG